MSASDRAALLPTVAAGFIAGLIIGSRWDVPFGAVYLFVLASILLAVLLVSIRRSALPALVLAAALLGLLRAGMVEPLGAELQPHHGAPRSEVQGVVTDDPTGSGSILTFRLTTERIRRDVDSPWVRVSEDVRVTGRVPSEIAAARETPYIKYGDRLVLTGSVEAPEKYGDFDFPAYLESQGIGSVISFPEMALIGEDGGRPFFRWLYSLRRSMARAIAVAVPEPQASFGQAILLGLRGGLPDSLTEDFRNSGTSHLLAISGLHVSILLAIGVSASEFLIGRRRLIYLLTPLLAIWIYALISGASDSSMRAAIMGTVYIAAIAVGRPRSLIPALALAATLMAALEPRVLTRISFQLSFAAMMGISIYREFLSDAVKERLGVGPEREGWLATPARGLAESVGITVAATLATAPLLAFYFERLSLVGLPATLLSMPALPLALVVHGVTALSGMALESAAMPLGWLAWLLSGYIIGIASLFARIPIASLETGQPAQFLVWMYYAAIATAILFLYSPIRWRFRRPDVRLENWSAPPWQFTALALVAAIVVWAAALTRPDGNMEVVFADVGQGDMTIISTPSGHTIVVDGGPDPERAIQVLDAHTPFWNRRVSLVILSHPHSDHVTGLNEVMRRYDVQRILELRSEYESADYAAWIRLSDSEGARILRARPGMRVSFKDGVEAQILHPPDSSLDSTGADVNDASVVVRVVYGNASFLLTGDIAAEGERWLIRSGQTVDSDVLKVAHHGSKTSSSEAFLDAVSPRAAIISAGRDNRFGHPDPEIVQRLEELESQPMIFRTYENGSIAFETDGGAISVKTDRTVSDIP